MFTPSKLPFFEASFIKLVNLSSTKRKRRGDKGHPYLRHLPGLKKGDVSPLIKITKDTEVMHLITQTTNE